MSKIYITRHGETKWNLEGRLQGSKNSELTELGMQQAIWLKDKLKNVELDIIISSSSGRAFDTAKILNEDRNIEIIKNDNLIEMNFGAWQGQLHVEIEKHSPEEQNKFWNLPHLYKTETGESFSEIIERVSIEIEKIISKYENKNILIITHGIVLKAIIAYFENKELKEFWNGEHIHPTCLNILEIEKGKKQFILKGDISHYPNQNIEEKY